MLRRLDDTVVYMKARKPGRPGGSANGCGLYYKRTRHGVTTKELGGGYQRAQSLESGRKNGTVGLCTSRTFSGQRAASSRGKFGGKRGRGKIATRKATPLLTLCHRAARDANTRPLRASPSEARDD